MVGKATTSAYNVSPTVEQAFQSLLSNEQIKKGLEFIKNDNDQTTQQQMDITLVPAPSFHEHGRTESFQELLIESGLEDVKIDQTGNVFGIRRGSGKGPKLVVSGHLDTVFPESAEIKVKWKDGKVFAPGIADDGRGLAVVLCLIRTLNECGIQTKGDLVIGGDVGEEGLGDLRGMKALFKDRKDFDAFISVEPGGQDRITYLATGSKRYKVVYTGPGGHSFGDFGTPSPIHALGRAIASISDIMPTKDPKTTFNVGLIQGGTSINSIAESATMFIDLRSNSEEQLRILEGKVLNFLKLAAEEENNRWSSNAIDVHIQLVGDRPAGVQKSDSIIVQTAVQATRAIGAEPTLEKPSSTDANVPINLGIPALTLGGGGDCGGAHTLDEYFDPTDAYLGVQKIFLTILAILGVDGISEPLLANR